MNVFLHGRFSVSRQQGPAGPHSSLKDTLPPFPANDAGGGGVELHRTAKRQKRINIMLAAGAVTFTPEGRGRASDRRARETKTDAGVFNLAFLPACGQAACARLTRSRQQRDESPNDFPCLTVLESPGSPGSTAKHKDPEREGVYGVAYSSIAAKRRAQPVGNERMLSPLIRDHPGPDGAKSRCICTHRPAH